MKMRRIVIENNGNKLSRQLLSLIDSSRVKNYWDTHIEVVVRGNSVMVSTFCANGYGRKLCNENHTVVSKSEIPYFSAKKLGLL
jgi:hypothetical protein